LSTLADLLAIDMSEDVRNFLFQAILLIQLQFASSHELGHMFHGHVIPIEFYEEFTSPISAGSAPKGNLSRQAKRLRLMGTPFTCSWIT
jgi:hypothetical protein